MTNTDLWVSLPKIQIKQVQVRYCPCDSEALFWVKVVKMRIPGKDNTISKCSLEAESQVCKKRYGM